MPPRPSTGRWLAVLLAVGLLVAACSGSSSDDAAEEPSTTGEPAESSTSESTPSDGADDGELALGLVGVRTLDPLGTSPASVSHMILADLLYDTLTELDDRGRPVPALATFAASADRTRWRFELTEEAVFDDGTPIGADDVAFSLDRIRSQGNASLLALQLEDVRSVEVVNPRTVDVTLREPSAILPEVLSSPVYGIVDRERTEEAQQVGSLTPLASGDHALTIESGRRLLLERRRGGGPRTVVVELFDDAGAAYEAFTTGTVHWAPIPPERQGEAMTEAGEVDLVPFHGTLMLGLNPQVAPLANRDLRRAIALSIDREPIVEAVFGAGAQPMLGLVPEGVPGAPSSCVGPCGPDREQARQLVAAALPQGQQQPLRLLVDDSEAQRTIAGVLRDQLGEIGLEVETTRLDPATVNTLINSGQQQLFLFGTLGVSRTPAMHLAPLFLADSPDNLTGYDNAFVAAAIRDALDQPIASLRAARWREIEAAVLDDAPVVPLAQLRTIAAVSSRVDGLQILADGSIDLSDVQVRSEGGD